MNVHKILIYSPKTRSDDADEKIKSNDNQYQYFMDSYSALKNNYKDFSLLFCY